jgi:hypothetical protein
MLSERETVVELPWAADCCPCVGKLRTVLQVPLTVGIRVGVVQLVSILGSWGAFTACRRARISSCTMGMITSHGETFHASTAFRRADDAAEAALPGGALAGGFESVLTYST